MELQPEKQYLASPVKMGRILMMMMTIARVGVEVWALVA
jgi:hypothetical protein